jgi:predicted Zn-dependent protease
MRIGNSSVSLNTSEELTRLNVRLVRGRREATHTQLGEIADADGVRQALHVVEQKVAVALEKDYEPILEVVEESQDQTDQFDEGLEKLDPAFKAQGYHAIFERVGAEYNYSGAWSSGGTEYYLISTANENEAYHHVSDMQFSVVLKHPQKKWELRADQTGWKTDDFSAAIAAEELHRYLSVYEKKEGVQLEPGRYTVLFGPTAVAELLEMALWTGFSGRLFEEKRAWTARVAYGEKFLSELITVTDDPRNPQTFMHGFDHAGKRREVYPLVEQGVFRNVMYDIATAAKYGKQPTGHTIESDSIVLATGDGPATVPEAVSDRDMVLSIPALHYMHVPNISEGLVTASSRFSATVMNNGEVAAPLLSSRITDHFKNIFGNVVAVAPYNVSVNVSNTYGRRTPVACSVPAYVLVEDVKITDSADSF